MTWPIELTDKRESKMRIMLIGDIVGKPGRQIVVRALPALIER